MNKSELAKQIAIDTGLSQTDAMAAINSFQHNVAASLSYGNNVVLVGFGTFKPIQKKARTGRNPATGEGIQIPAKIAVSFVAGKGLKEAVN